MRRPQSSATQRSNANCQLRIAPVWWLHAYLALLTCYTKKFNMPSRYAQWMYDWEHRLTSVDNNRVVRPLEWGLEWARDWPCRNGDHHGEAANNPENFFLDYNRRIVAASDEFYSYARPSEFQLERREVQVFSTREIPDPKLETKVKGMFGEFLRFSSPVRT